MSESIHIVNDYVSYFQDLLKLGHSAGEIQFLTLCYFLYQRFKMLNKNLVSLRTSMHLIVNKLRTKTLHRMWSPTITNISGKILPYSRKYNNISITSYLN